MASKANTSTAEMASHKEFKIGGLSVLFPCKPYPSQFSMMDKIIRGIQRQQNCLLESPTGSGKSLALLCSALAWQAQERAKQHEEMAKQAAENEEGACCCSCHNGEAPPPPSGTRNTDTAAMPLTSATVENAEDHTSLPAAFGANSSSMCAEKGGHQSPAAFDDSDDEFKPLQKYKSTGKSSVETKKKRKPVTIEYEDSPSPTVSVKPETAVTNTAAESSDYVAVTPCSKCDCGKDEKTPIRKVPKIYFGTRTHKQVAQIVRELRKTAYHDVSMTILASREHTCVHPEVSRAPNKNEGCENLVKEVGCRFKDRVMKYQSQHAVRSMGLTTAWDLEDMVSLMRKKKVCPYFLTRGLKDQSDLIICPYNYLVDPLIRDSMEINLKDQIVLLDEAHNIEDASREAASHSFTQEQIQRAMQNMDELIEKNINVADISKLRQMCHKLDSFVDEHSSSLTQHDFEQSYRMWSGFEIVAQLRRLDLGPDKCKELASVLQSLKAAEAEERMNNPTQDQQAKISSATGGLLEAIFLIMKYIYSNDMKHAEDYRASIVKSIKYMPADHNGSWMNSRRHFGGRRTVPVEVFTLNFWCMNPAVGFADFGLCRSVILTSGTLSPMDSFQSELGLPFPIVLEANHVIKDSQVWVGAIGEGPSGTSLQAVYRNMETFDFQDQLGQLILEVCKKVPKGVLCFLPSYKTLEKLSNRWKTTGLWMRLEAEKRVFSEPRGSDKADFEHIMLAFSNVVKGSYEPEDEDESSKDGALLFAVCRGKVSEGMDFADNSARAVITVGIPYPNFKDIQVELKRKYNDQHQAARRLLSGHLWYEIQAFRALNQALGRCIRHRRDWGALIIVDDRFVKNTKKYANGLSKWVRRKLQVHQRCSAMLESLSQFTEGCIEEQQKEESMDSSLTSTPLTPASQPTQSDSPRPPLYDVSNFKTPSTASIPLSINSPLIKTDGKPTETEDCLLEQRRKPLPSAVGSSPFFERKTSGVAQNKAQPPGPDAKSAGSTNVQSTPSVAASSRVADTSQGGFGTRTNEKEIDTGMSMMFVPLKDPTLKPLMMILPSSSPTQQSISLPPQFQQAFGGQLLTVPPMVQRIVLAPTLEEANQLFLSSLHASGVLKTNVVSPSGGQEMIVTPAVGQNQQKTDGGSTPAVGVPGQGSGLSVVSPTSGVTPAASVSNSNRQSTSNPVASPSVDGNSPALFDDASPLQSPHRTMKSLLTGKIVTMPAATAIDAQSLPTAQPPQDDDDVVCVGVMNGNEKSTAGTDSSVTLVNRKQLFRRTPSKLTGVELAASSVDTTAPTAGADTTTSSAKNCRKTLHVPDTTDDHASNHEAASDEVKVERRLRGSKRRTLSLDSKEAKKGRISDPADQEKTAVLKCSACGHILLEDVKTSDYERRETMPSFLKGVSDKSSPEVLYFYGASITQKLKVADSASDNSKRQQWPGGLEASVQLVRCPNCQKSNTGSVLGARVTLSDPNASAATGQMWIFSHMIDMNTQEEK